MSALILNPWEPWPGAGLDSLCRRDARGRMAAYVIKHPNGWAWWAMNEACASRGSGGERFAEDEAKSLADEAAVALGMVPT